MIVKFLKHEDMRAATVAAAVLWALAPSSHLRASIAELGGVTALHGLLVRTLKACSSYKHGVCSCAGSSAKWDNGYQVVLLATSECVIQAICTESSVAGALKARWYWFHVHSFVGSEESTTTVWTAGNEFCLSHQNKIGMFGSGFVHFLCELACFVISQNSMKLRCHSSTFQNS
jgi:hypothetical protein